MCCLREHDLYREHRSQATPKRLICVNAGVLMEPVQTSLFTLILQICGPVLANIFGRIRFLFVCFNLIVHWRRCIVIVRFG